MIFPKSILLIESSCTLHLRCIQVWCVHWWMLCLLLSLYKSSYLSPYINWLMMENLHESPLLQTTDSQHASVLHVTSPHIGGCNQMCLYGLCCPLPYWLLNLGTQSQSHSTWRYKNPEELLFSAPWLLLLSTYTRMWAICLKRLHIFRFMSEKQWFSISVNWLSYFIFVLLRT